jgi:predicted enzyme related to lactoylglutathione lyase
MPHVIEHPPGTPCWVDLATTDLEEATQFYAELFGWSVETRPLDSSGYRMCVYDGRRVAGMGVQPEAGRLPRWNLYLGVLDADQTASSVAANGGSVLVPPVDVSDLGRTAVVTDPGGAAFSLWQPRAHTGAGIVDESNTCCWHELITRAGRASVDFYRAVFGWHAHRHGESDLDYVEFHLDDESVAGLSPMPLNPMVAADRLDQAPNAWRVYFAVDDVDATTARVVELGGTVAMEPSEILTGRFAIVDDPQGARFDLITFRSEAA